VPVGMTRANGGPAIAARADAFQMGKQISHNREQLAARAADLRPAYRDQAGDVLS
jgi:hypothetical protein